MGSPKKIQEYITYLTLSIPRPADYVGSGLEYARSLVISITTIESFNYEIHFATEPNSVVYLDLSHLAKNDSNLLLCLDGIPYSPKSLSRESGKLFTEALIHLEYLCPGLSEIENLKRRSYVRKKMNQSFSKREKS